MLNYNPFSKWFWGLFTPKYIHALLGSGTAGGASVGAAPATGGLSLLAPFAVSLGSKLFGSIFGGGGGAKPSKEAQEARRLLLSFGKGGQSDLFPEQDLLDQAFRSIQTRVGQQKQSASARAASIGLSPGQGLVQSGLLAPIQRNEANAFGQARTGVGIAKSNAQLQSLMALLGLPNEQQGIDVPNVLAQSGQDLSQLLLFKQFLGK